MKEFKEYVEEAEVLFNKGFITSKNVEYFKAYNWITGEESDIEEPTFLILKALEKLKKQ